MPAGLVKMVITASVNWLACMMQSVPIRPTTEKKIAKGFHFFPIPSVIMYIGPP